MVFQTAATGGTSEATGHAPRLGVILVDPLATVRAALQLLIESDAEMEVLAAAGTADDALAALTGLGRGGDVLVLLSLGLPGERDCFWLIRALRERHPTVAVVACGAGAGQAVISRALFVGADGFVDKNADPADFLGALRRAAQGDVVLVGPPPEWIGPISALVDRGEKTARLLSGREIQVLSLAAEGLTARQIGERLELSDRTITTHLGRIYSKLGVSTRLAAVVAATRAGLISSTAPQG